MTVIRTWEADLSRRLNIGGLIEFDKTTIGKTLHVPCAVGKHLVDFKIRANLDPNGAVKQMINAGWTVGRRRPSPALLRGRDLQHRHCIHDPLGLYLPMRCRICGCSTCGCSRANRA